MKIDPKVHTQRSLELRSKAQEETDAAGGERIAAQRAKGESVKFRDEYQAAQVAGKELLNEAAKLRADAAEQLKQALGPRGTHAMANVVRGFASLVNKLSGNRLETTVSLKADPEAKATAERMKKLAESKEQEAQAKFAMANNSWVKSTEALSKMEGHERTAASHMEAAAKLMKEAKREGRMAALAETAQNIGATVKEAMTPYVDQALTEGKKVLDEAKAEGKRNFDSFAQMLIQKGTGAMRDLLFAGIKILVDVAKDFLEPNKPAPQEAAEKPPVGGRITKQDAEEIIKVARGDRKPPAAEELERAKAGVREWARSGASKLSDGEKRALEDFVAQRATKFEPGRVDFGGGPRSEVKLPAGPRIDAPPNGDKKLSDSALAMRWAAEAEGIDWTKFSSTGQLKDAVAGTHKNPLGVKNSSSSFEVKKRISERLGLKDPHNLDVNTVRDLYARREALGLNRLTPRAEYESALAKLGLKSDSSIDQLAMAGMAKNQQALADAAKALKAAPDDAKAQQAFKDIAAKLDRSKATMLQVLSALPKEDRRTLALDACDAVEHAHGKPGAQAKLAHAADVLGNSGLFMGAMKKALGVDDKALDKAMQPALRALEWVSLGEMKSSSAVLAYPGALSDEQKKAHIFPLASHGVTLAKDLALLDEQGLETLKSHMSFKGNESVSAQLLGVIRQVAALSERRDFRTKELLAGDEVLEELKKNAARASLNPAFIDALAPIIDDVVKALRK